MSPIATIRPPWPDEMPRVKYFLPNGFTIDPNPFVLVSVIGRVERFIAALTFTLRPLETMHATWLSMRVDNEHPSGADLLQRGLEEAWKRGANEVYLGQTLDENSPAAIGFRQLGFEATSTHEVYETDPKPLFERLDRIYQRMKARNMIPNDVEIMTLQPALLPKARKFLLANMPNSASALALESSGYKPENSLALLQNGEVKGVLLARRMGRMSHTGLRVVAEELRGAFGWANLVLLHASLFSGLQTGLETTRFEFNPQHHHDTQQFADMTGAKLVHKRLLFKIRNPKKNG